MTAAAAKRRLDADSYLAWEEQQPDKHEYVRDGVCWWTSPPGG